ncbi:hypothetical protein SBRCBS47491_000953 [Sporothrix bragantina]|uniref:UBC core domain-containing protein n=1 Tax=Sporothrix bragantina TaxID=671064 RepID=A0ABP0AUM3_9PEZI
MSARNGKTPTIRRILREAQELAASPSADLAAAPLETDLFEWHFTLRGPPNSVYADGIYHGRIVLPPTYPLRPPSFRFVTPSGRFEANREICLSISGHHEETWQPAWGLRTALVALRSFMETDPKGQVGGLDASDAVRRRLASESSTFVCNGCGGRTNAAILAESAEEEAALKQKQSEEEKAAAAAADVVPPELKMAYRDELQSGSAASTSTENASGAATPAMTTATTPLSATPAPPTPREGQPSPPVAPAAAAPAHAVPVPTPTIPLPASQAAAAHPHPPAPAPLTIAAGRTAGRTQPNTPQAPLTPLGAVVPAMTQAQLRARRNSDEGVPLWVDRTIVVLSVILGAMLLRLVFG